MTVEALVECIPNYSVGNQPELLRHLAEPFEQEEQIQRVLVEPDDDYNRTVITVIGAPEAVLRAMVHSAARASACIDLRLHHGAHKRIGAIDVIPFVPLQGMTKQQAIELAHRCGESLHAATGIPIYYYRDAALRPQCQLLSDIRRGEFEGLSQKMKDPLWHPDLGSASPHPRCGASVIGVRQPLIAYNVELESDDVKIARQIAKAVRFSSGGYRGIQAQGVFLPSRGHIQVTMNVTDYRSTALYRAYEAVVMEARRYGVRPVLSELVGMMPIGCAQASAAYYRGLQTGEGLSLEEVVSILQEKLLVNNLTVDKVLDIPDL